MADRIYNEFRHLKPPSYSALAMDEVEDGEALSIADIPSYLFQSLWFKSSAPTLFPDSNAHIEMAPTAPETREGYRFC